MQTLNWILTLLSNMSLTVERVISLGCCVWCWEIPRLVVGALRLGWISRTSSGRTTATSRPRGSRRNSQWESVSWRSRPSSSSPSPTPSLGGATWTEEWSALCQGTSALCYKTCIVICISCHLHWKEHFTNFQLKSLSKHIFQDFDRNEKIFCPPYKLIKPFWFYFRL